MGFLYSKRILLEAGKVSIDVKNVPITVVLKQCFVGQLLDYAIQENTIIITKKPGVILKVQIPDPAIHTALLINVHGKAVNENNEPMEGITITVKGTRRGTSTGKNGEFRLTGIDGDATLVFTGIGVEQLEIKVNGRSEIPDVRLKIKVNYMAEAVVVGYGSTKRKDLTGSVVSVNVNEIKDVPYASIDQALSGKAAGVQVVQGDGSPGGVASIRIRGGTSILGGNDPLYIIDGVQVTPLDRYITTPGEVVDPIAQSAGNSSANGALSGSFARGLNSLAGLNINDIATIDILKDASGTAIYGSKAANGVVIITTKKGSFNEKPIFEFNNYTGVSKPIKAKLLNADQYRSVLKEAAQNLVDAQTAAGDDVSTIPNKILTDPNFLGNANTDWLGLVLRNGISQNTDISIRGGSKSSRYYTSLSYTNQTGVVLGTDFKRISGKINFDNDITDKIKFITNINYGFTRNNITNGAYSQALYAPPTKQPYNDDGTLARLNGSAVGSLNASGFQNPLALLNGINEGKNGSFLGSLALEYNIAKGLKFRSQASINYNSYHQRNFTPSNSLVKVASGAGGSSQGGIGSQGQTESTSSLYENTLNYIHQFNSNHRLDAVIGTSWQLDKSNTFQASGQGYPDDIILNNIGSAVLALPNISGSTQNSLLSFYARVNYAYQDKYLLTVTGRSDASSKFPSNNQVGYFPSAGIGWRISQENFLKNVSWVDDIKLRASMGYTGTQNIGDNSFRTLYTTGSYNGSNATIPTQLGNSTIKWESTLQKDAGIDFSFFKSRLVGGIGIYEKKSSGLLYTVPLAPSSSYSTLIANLADIRNRGLEIQLNIDIIRGKTFSWNTSINTSFNRSLVTNLNSIFADPNHGNVVTADGVNYISANSVLISGSPVGQFVGLNFLGIIQSKAQLDSYLSTQPYYTYFTPYINIGDPMYSLMGDFPDNGQFIGTASPKYYGGITNNISYKNFSLSALLNYSVGGHILYLAEISNHSVNDLTNKSTAILNHWTPTNTTSDRPRLIYGYNASGTANNNIYSSSYLKLKSITLNYRFPKELIKRANIENLSIYFSATNLFTITRYPGQDPEVSNDPYSLVDGYTDSNNYPTIKQYVLGLRLSF
ncbi:TonB-dependent receptor [Pedobacter changchengzhani]|nr:TonB-dependent receptor [Pedobacter changchengzhani]